MQRFVLLALLVTVAAGCGGSKRVSDAAAVVPADATAYALLHPSRDRAVLRALARTPMGADSVAALRAKGPAWLERALPGAGREVDVALLPAGAIVLTQPSDAKAYAKRLDAQRLVHANVEGWAVVARSPAALAAVRHRRGALATAPWFVHARRSLAGVAGPLVVEKRSGDWHAATASAKGKTVEQQVNERGRGTAGTAPSALAAAAPDDALYVLEVATLSAVPRLPDILGLDVRAVLRAAGAPLALWVTPGAPVPDVTIVARPADLRAHERSLAALLARQGSGRNVPLRSGALESLDLGPITVYWGIVRRALVAGTSPDIPPPAGKKVRGILADAGVPPRVERLTYVHDEQALPVFQAFASLAGETLSHDYVADASVLSSEVTSLSRRGAVTTSIDYRRLR